MQGYNWRLLTILSILPIFLLGVVAFFALDESPRWVLIARGEAEAKQLLRKIAIRNDAGGGRYLPTLDALQLRIVRPRQTPRLCAARRLLLTGRPCVSLSCPHRVNVVPTMNSRLLKS